MVTQEFNLNLIPDGGPVVVHVNQYDHGTGRFIISLYKDDEEYAPTATVKIEGRKPDGNVFSYSASLSGNVVTADVTQQMTAVAGRTLAQVVVTESTGVTGTLLFWLDVQRAAIDGDAPISDTEIPAIIDGAEAQARRAEEAAANAAKSEANAVGSETNAAKSEANATSSAANAANSEANAARSEANAASSAANAANSEANAARSETNASKSETNAASSEKNALDSEGNAKDYSRDAEAWAVGQRDGKDVPADDETYQNSSKFWAKQAAASAAKGGHAIMDMEDTTAPVRTNLKFMWSLLQDDEDGDTTKVYPSVLLTYMALNNDFLDVLVDEEGNPIIDGEGNAILVDWRYEVA